MFDFNKKLNQFFEDDVRLKEKHTTLREYRDKNLERLSDGTKKLADKGEALRVRVNDYSQGSMAMHTINQAQHEDDHDIDHAIIYDSKDIYTDPQDARDFVARALKETGGNFKVDPEAKTNAVTITYQDGYHVDFAIYKRIEIGNEQYEFFHAGETWTKRHPLAITEWFNSSNSTLSPKSTDAHVEVLDGQLRRIVRLFKFWAKSRSEWSLPGGLILSVLIVKNYVSNNKRDDIALYETLKKVSNELAFNKNVTNPVDSSLSLITNEKHRKQMDSLQEKLENGLDQLSRLLEYGCSEEKASRSWGDFFETSYWENDTMKKSETVAVGISKLNVRVTVTKKTQWGTSKFTYNPKSGQTIPKRAMIKFELLTQLPPNAKISWEVKNRGDEARWDNQISPRAGAVDESNRRICNEPTKFRGNHTMNCLVEYDQVKIVESIPIRIR